VIRKCGSGGVPDSGRGAGDMFGVLYRRCAKRRGDVDSWNDWQANCWTREGASAAIEQQARGRDPRRSDRPRTWLVHPSRLSRPHVEYAWSCAHAGDGATLPQICTRRGHALTSAVSRKYARPCTAVSKAAICSCSFCGGNVMSNTFLTLATVFVYVVNNRYVTATPSLTDITT
jgi:hypothetical protein